MAKADDTTSKNDWIWLRDALALAVKRLGSVALAKERLIEWLAAGKLPWSCMSWKGLGCGGPGREKAAKAGCGATSKAEAEAGRNRGRSDLLPPIGHILPM